MKSATPLIIRRVTPDEAEALAELGRETFIATFASDNDPANLVEYVAAAFDPSEIRAQIGTDGSEFFFAEIDERPVGYLKLNTGAAQAEEMPGRTLEIERIYLTGEAQGLGLGKALLDLAVERAIENGCEAVWLGVWERNPKAKQFYETRGFVPFGSHTFVIGADYQTDILMRFDL
ncbi:MAG: GNAT family N-acetyltransferase [Pseudomonadota bacterium]